MVISHTLIILTYNCVGLLRSPPPTRLKSPCLRVNVCVGSLTMSGTATPPIRCNPGDTSRGLHGIGWVGPPSHFSEVGFFGEAIEPSRKPFFRKFTCTFPICLGRRIHANLVDTFTLLLMKPTFCAKSMAGRVPSMAQRPTAWTPSSTQSQGGCATRNHWLTSTRPNVI